MPEANALPDLVTKLDGGKYLFTGILYQSRTLNPFEFEPRPLNQGNERTRGEWAKFSKSNSDKSAVADIEILYQILRRLYCLRNNEKYQHITQECRASLREIFDKNDYFITSTGIRYGQQLDAAISHAGPSGDIITSTVDVPEFNAQNEECSYLDLAPEQSEPLLGNVSPLESRENQLLQKLLGAGYMQAGAVLQYCVSEVCTSQRSREGQLRPIRLWVPTAKRRNRERSVILGIDDLGVGSFGFALDTDVDIQTKMPALGIRILNK